jgi:hypothetical protein
MSGLWVLLQLVFGFAVVLAPGALLARTLGVRGASATLAWALALVFAALAVTFLVHGSLALTLVLLLSSERRRLFLALPLEAVPLGLLKALPLLPLALGPFAVGALLALAFNALGLLGLPGTAGGVAGFLLAARGLARLLIAPSRFARFVLAAGRLLGFPLTTSRLAGLALPPLDLERFEPPALGRLGFLAPTFLLGSAGGLLARVGSGQPGVRSANQLKHGRIVVVAQAETLDLFDGPLPVLGVDEGGDSRALGDPGSPLLDLALDLRALGEAGVIADELGDDPLSAGDIARAKRLVGLVRQDHRR